MTPKAAKIRSHFKLDHNPQISRKYHKYLPWIAIQISARFEENACVNQEAESFFPQISVLNAHPISHNPEVQPRNPIPKPGYGNTNALILTLRNYPCILNLDCLCGFLCVCRFPCATRPIVMDATCFFAGNHSGFFCRVAFPSRPLVRASPKKQGRRKSDFGFSGVVDH